MMEIKKSDLKISDTSIDEGFIRHNKCMGYKYWTDCGYYCDYGSELECDDCKYGGGRKDPEAKCNQLD